jgi:HSP20 family molecular chaperone IbpA
MKTHSLKTNTRIWTSRLFAAGLGLSGLTCFGAAPASDSQAAAANQQPAANQAAGNSGAENNAGNVQPNTTQPNNSQGWEDQFTNRMQRIQKEMDDLFRDSVNDLDTGAFAGPRFDASATVQDRGDNYVATFNLPKRDLSNVKVNVKDGILSVNASAEQTTRSNPADKNNAGSETEMLNEYEQLVTLPGPVDASRMKIDKHGDSVVITLPKKEEKTAQTK